MATVNKDFRVKHGLVVEGSTATVNGSNVLTEASTEFIQDLVGLMVDGGTETNISVTYDDVNGKLNFAAENGIADSTTTDLVEGTNLYFTDERAQDAVGNVVGTGLAYNDTTGAISTSNIPNTSLENSSITINGATTSLGGSRTLHTDDISEDGSPTNLWFTDERAQDAVGNVVGTGLAYNDTTGAISTSNIPNTSLANSSITINGFPISLGGSATYGTDNISEGTTNKYFTDERAQDAIASAIAGGTQTNISVTYDDVANTFSFNATGGVASLSGTANEVEVTNVGTAYTIGLPNDITVAGNITINGTPSNGNHAATVAYVDAATAGLNVHESVKAATTGNITLATDVENGDLLDGVTLATGMRILVKNQTDKSKNGIYTVAASGAPTRAADYNSVPEVDAGDFIFVEGGTVNGKTGWVQTNNISTIGSDDIEFTQFSGAGTYQEGNGITLTGNVFSIDTDVTVDKDSVQTLTNKTLTSPILTNPSVSGLYLSDNNIIIEGTDNTFETTLTFNDPTVDRTITFPDATGTVAFTSDITSAINAISTTDIEEGTNLYFTDERAQDAVGNAVGTGLSYNDTTGAISNSGVTGITGTANQVIASGSTGSVTLSLPQSIHTAATPTFGSVSVGSVTLADALIGTATQSLTDTSATVIDSWSTELYSSAKYIVQMKKGTDVEVIEVLVTVDGNNNVYITEYANIISNTSIGTTDADLSSGNVRLLVTASSGTTVKIHKTLIEA
jgi:hypothetical protein